MVVTDCDGDGKASIYVGSAQGLITRSDVVQSQSPGHGVSGLAAGDPHPNGPGDEIIAAATANPRIAVDNLDNDVAAEIVFATVHGMIVVLDGNLNPLAYHQETGIIDIVVGPTPHAQHRRTVPQADLRALPPRRHCLARVGPARRSRRHSCRSGEAVSRVHAAVR